MLVLINSVIEHDARYVRFQDVFRSIGNVTLGRTRTDFIVLRTSFYALCGQGDSKGVSQYFYLRRSQTSIALFLVALLMVYVMPAQATP